VSVTQFGSIDDFVVGVARRHVGRAATLCDLLIESAHFLHLQMNPGLLLLGSFNLRIITIIFDMPNRENVLLSSDRICFNKEFLS